ncbi:hypothetical protein [Roseovarius salinarum]|uniref:hypothetical protein n=1 Tax=Roseovarius salinarum TaxID=1981892 RepID=UPI001E5ADC1D|nr:hypothetical protein [Roseovarius salinarum]
MTADVRAVAVTIVSAGVTLSSPLMPPPRVTAGVALASATIDDQGCLEGRIFMRSPHSVAHPEHRTHCGNRADIRRAGAMHS